MHRIRAKPLVNYEGYLKKHLFLYFGQYDNSDLTIDDVQEFMNSKAAYSKKIIEELLLTLGMILNAVKEDGLLSINPAKSKRLLNPSGKKSVREALTFSEADDIESHLQDIPQLRDRWYAAMILKFPARYEDIRSLQIKNSISLSRPSASRRASPMQKGIPSSETQRRQQENAKCSSCRACLKP